MFFTHVFVLTPVVTGEPSFVTPDNRGPADYQYFRFVTLATLGYGDLVARTNLGHLLSVTEALVGQTYLVTVVALLVSQLPPRTPRSDE